VSDIPADQQEALEKQWRFLNLQIDTFLKQRQYNTEIWKVVIAAAAAGAALAGAFIGLGAVLARHL